MSSKPHSEAEDRAKQLEARKEVVRRILSKHSAKDTYEECLVEFLVDCFHLSGREAVGRAHEKALEAYCTQKGSFL